MEYDILLGEPTSPRDNSPASVAKIDQLKRLTPQQRWEFWKNEFSRCVRCYACRNVCPACYCQRCFVEESEPQWLSPAPSWQDNLLFQVVRNLHVAGRCTDCGACERACPVNIPLRSLTKEMYDIVGDLFEFKSGMDRGAAPLLTAYELSEAEEFFR
jgi:ferredoxin